MDLIKKNKVVFALVISVLILILIRSLGSDHFKSDAKRWAEPSVSRSNLITITQAVNLHGEKLIINLGNDTTGLTQIIKDVINIPADSVLIKKNIHALRDHNGPLLIYSPETAISAKIWMILSQMGFDNIYILTREVDIEVLKYKFRPDSVTGPEL